MVPESAESTLSLYIYDFFFEIKEQNNLKCKEQKVAEKVVGVSDQPNPKKPRNNAPVGGETNLMDGGAKNDNSGGGQDKSLKVANMVGQKMLNQHQAK
jgi:hypothetical protein